MTNPNAPAYPAQQGRGMSDFAYIGKCRGCGAIRAATIEGPEHLSDVAQSVSEFIMEGLQIERTPIAEVRTTGNWECTCSGNVLANPVAGS